MSVERHGKRLKIVLDGDIEVLFHLRMTGRLYWSADNELQPPHLRFVMTFSSGRLFLIDPRRFATVSVRARENQCLAGRDAWMRWDPAVLEDASRGRKRPVKSFLMDQDVIAGIGNIYACEILFRAGIHPCRKACDVSQAQWSRIAESMTAVLSEAVSCRGTTFSDWRDLFGNKGEYQNRVHVYGRKDQACRHCGSTIQRTAIGGRGTFFCPHCQAL